MAEKKKMSVADILAAARKADSGQASGGAGGEPAVAEPAVAAEPAAAPANAAAVPAEPAVPKPAPPKPAAAAGGKPSIAEVLALARANKMAAGDAPAAVKPVPTAAVKGPAVKGPAVKGPAGEKPAAKIETPAAVKERAAAKVGDGEAAPRDTSSILAAARAGAKAGPMSKAEAAVKLKPQPQITSTATATGKPAKAAAAVAPPPPAKPEYARPKPSNEPAIASEDRRFFLFLLLGSSLALGFVTLSATMGLWTLAFARFMFPNILMEPPNKFKVGFTGDFPAGGVEEKYKPQFGVWVVNTEYKGRREIFALKTVCTHLGCTPNWLEAEQKFKCPCHGSGFYKDGINFEGPAPRPLERYAIRVADDGQLEVDKSKTFQEELGQWADPASFVTV